MYLPEYVIHWKTLTEEKVSRIKGTPGRSNNIYRYQTRKIMTHHRVLYLYRINKSWYVPVNPTKIKTQ